jgi:hypothetical protein
MPIREYECDLGHREERIELRAGAGVSSVCAMCGSISQPLMSVPARVIMGDGSAARRRDRIKEPIWRYPDGHIEPVNP